MGSRPLLGGARTSSRYSTVATPLASLASALNSTGNVLGSSSVKFDKGGGLSRVTAGGVRSARQGSGARVVVLVELVVVVEVLVIVESHPTVVTAPFTATLNLRGKGPELSHMKKRSGIGSVPVILGWVSSPPSRNTLNTALNAAAGANVGG